MIVFVQSTHNMTVIFENTSALKMSIPPDTSIDDVQITFLLANDAIFCARWRLFCKALGFDHSIKHDLERMATNSCSITDIIQNIMSHWKSISSNTNLLTLSEKLREIKCTTSAAEIEKLCKLDAKNNGYKIGLNTHSIWFNVPRSTTFFVGRENEMLEIENQWKNSVDKKEILFVAITGLGGIGKSELAKNYARTFYENNSANCVWIDAETNKSLLESLQSLAKKELRITVTNETGKDKKLHTLVEEIYDKLTNNKCLIIIDNLEFYENDFLSILCTIASLKPPKVLKPFVIITSRFQPAIRFFGNKCTPIELPVLTKDSASKFFLNSFGLNTNVYLNIIGRLCERLHYYPLAMQQASAYINENLLASDLMHQIRKHLNKIENESKKLLDYKLPRYEALDTANKTTYLAWKITLDKIKKDSEVGHSATHVIKLSSFLFHDNISTEFILNILEEMGILSEQLQRNLNIFHKMYNYINKKKVKSKANCFQVLRNHSMISFDNHNISIHRLVQEVVRIRLKEEGEMTRYLDKLVTCTTKMMKLNKIPTDQMIHVEKIWEHVTKNSELIKRHEAYPRTICVTLSKLGKYKDAYDFICQAVSVLELNLGDDNRETLRLKYCNGRLLIKMGEYIESLQLLTEVYEKQMTLFGDEDTDRLHTSHELGIVYWNLSNHTKALNVLQNCLKESVRIYGEKDLLSLRLKNSIALLLIAQGKYNEAIEMIQEGLNGQTEDQLTLITKRILAIVHYYQNDFEVAMLMFQEILKVQGRVLGPNHPETLTTKGWIANTYKSLDRNVEAFQLAEEVFENKIEVLGKRHPETIDIKNVLLESLVDVENIYT